MIRSSGSSISIQRMPQRVLAELDQADRHGGGAVEYRFRHRRGHYIWIQDTFTVRHDNDRQAEGDRRFLGGHLRPQAGRGRAAATCRAGGAAQPVHSRDLWSLSDGRSGRHSCSSPPRGLQMGGEKRKVTMMMTDLRGFTSLSERLAPERVVAMLNRYLTTMVTDHQAVPGHHR